MAGQVWDAEDGVAARSPDCQPLTLGHPRYWAIEFRRASGAWHGLYKRGGDRHPGGRFPVSPLASSIDPLPTQCIEPSAQAQFNFIHALGFFIYSALLRRRANLMTALAPPPSSHHPFFDYHHHPPPSCPPSPSMQPPPLRQRLSQTYINRSPPIPPSLLDSPYVQSPNSPFRRDHYINPPTPSYATGHDALNLLDTVPIDPSTSRPIRVGAQQEPDDIGLAGTPKTAKSSSIVNHRPPRPGMNRSNSWLREQQQAQDWRQQGHGQHPASQLSQSYLPSQQQPNLLPSALPPSRAVPLPLSTPYPIPQQHPPSAYSSRSYHPSSASLDGSANRS